MFYSVCLLLKIESNNNIRVTQYGIGLVENNFNISFHNPTTLSEVLKEGDIVEVDADEGEIKIL